jgi:phosphoglycolate phosphatase-like HAD superfamily hydrolase
MMLPIRDCQSIIFDCDGVILQSNQLKSDAFACVLADYDQNMVTTFIKWHKKYGGISRFEKFAYFFRDMLALLDWEEKTQKACSDFSVITAKKLLNCPYIKGFERYLEFLETQKITLSVNTGGAETEVQEVFRKRGLLDKFECILGSPSTKMENMCKLQSMGLMSYKTVYFGDSRLDFDLARNFGLHFVYVGQESEWPEGKIATDGFGGYSIFDYECLLDLK